MLSGHLQLMTTRAASVTREALNRERGEGEHAGFQMKGFLLFSFSLFCPSEAISLAPTHHNLLALVFAHVISQSLLTAPPRDLVLY